MNRKILIVFLSLLFVWAGHSEVVAQQTGTQIKDVNSSYQTSVVWFDMPTEITDIRLLLQGGEKEAAVEKARAYVASLDNVNGVQAKRRRYYAFNALCASLTSVGKIDEAWYSATRESMHGFLRSIQDQLLTVVDLVRGNNGSHLLLLLHVAEM